MGRDGDGGGTGSSRTNRALVPEALARAAVNYQQYRSQLDALRRQRLAAVRVGSGGDGARSLNPRRGAAALTLIHESRVARDAFRDEVRHLVDYLQSTGAPLRRILDHIHAVLDALQAAGVLHNDGGAMAYELAHWIIEDHSQRQRPRPAEPSRQPVGTGRGKSDGRVLPLVRRTSGGHAL